MSKIRKFISVTKEVALWPFRMIRKGLKIIVLVLIAISLGYGAKEGYDYLYFAHSYHPDDPCPEFTKAMFTLSSELEGSLRCLNATDTGHPPIAGEKRRFVLFLASEASPTPQATGHGWVIWLTAALSKDGKYVLSEFLPTGFGPEVSKPKWPDWLVKYYAKFQQHIPESIEPSVSKLFNYLYLPMVKGNEGAPVVTNGSVVIDENFRNTPVFNTLFGSKPQVILAVAVSELEYENSKRYQKRFAETDYGLLINDCTTFVYDVADEVNLYTPPRALNPFPFDSVTAISKLNRAYGKRGANNAINSDI